MTVTSFDARIIAGLIARRLRFASRGRRPLSELKERLLRASCVEEIPPDVVTMNSVVFVRELKSAAGFCVALVFPWEAEPTEARVSVLSPLGTVLLGRRSGDVAVCRDAGRSYQFLIEDVVFQPEAALSAPGRRP